jgi:hypothetical protein
MHALQHPILGLGYEGGHAAMGPPFVYLEDDDYFDWVMMVYDVEGTWHTMRQSKKIWCSEFGYDIHNNNVVYANLLNLFCGFS